MMVLVHDVGHLQRTDDFVLVHRLLILLMIVVTLQLRCATCSSVERVRGRNAVRAIGGRGPVTTG